MSRKLSPRILQRNFPLEHCVRWEPTDVDGEYKISIPHLGGDGFRKDGGYSVAYLRTVRELRFFCRVCGLKQIII